LTQLVWFRTDLRSRDNPALWHACKHIEEGVVGVVFVTRQQWLQHGLGERKIQLMENTMLALKAELESLNIPLLILTANTFADCNQILQRIIIQLNIRSVAFNIEYEVNERRRDIEFGRWCREQQVELYKFHDQCVVPPGEVRTKQGQPFKVFTPFKRAWIQQAEDIMAAPLPQPGPCEKNIQAPLIALINAQASLSLNTDPITASADPLWPVSEEEAHLRLNNFAYERGIDYKKLRDFPAEDMTSRLSVYLSLGLISARQCLHVALDRNNGLFSGGKPGFDCWISELIWREFYRHLLVAFPQLCKHKAFKPETEQVCWRDSEADFQAWCEGRTGYPIVDAAQKQLLQEGWMHNRLRMISAMFLTKHLLIDWRKGEAFFNKWLLDADLASNNGGWQWSASTGADGVPYFRIFNPTTQSQRFDAEGQFIVRYLPELTPLPAAARHQPDSLQRQRCGYPQAVVEHKFARQRALDAFKQTLTAADAGDNNDE
jgi:deoxyribodipyrimidine photo-lyase